MDATLNGVSQVVSAATGQDVRITSPNFDMDHLPDNAKRECILFYYHETEELARQIAGSNSHVQLASISWK